MAKSPALQRQRARSKQLAESARRAIPGGINSNFRKDENYDILFVDRGEGARLYDVDGNDYIDYSLSYGPAILGHGNSHLRQAIVGQLGKLHSAENTELEQQAARKLISHVPCAQSVRFACSGTEANYFALRAARAYTNRTHVVRFVGHYHGGSDELLGGIRASATDPRAVAGERGDDYFSQMTHTAGRNPDALGRTLLLEWNDEAALEDAFRRFGSDLAAVLMEPVMVNNFGCLPRPGYLEKARELCTRHDAVLIFDEVLTGFRMGLGGAQAAFGVTADMATFGKALGGGWPVSAFCGREEIMRHIASTDVVAGGTYNGHPVMMAAVIATIEALEANDGAAYARIARHGQMLKDGLSELARSFGQPLLLQGFPGAWTFSFTAQRQIDNHAQGCATDVARALRFNALLKRHGVLATQRLCTSLAHGQEDVEEALERAGRALADLSA